MNKSYFAAGVQEGRAGTSRFKRKVQHRVLTAFMELLTDADAADALLSQLKVSYAVKDGLMVLTLPWADTERKQVKSFLKGKRKGVFVSGDGNYMALARTEKEALLLLHKAEG